MKKPKKFPIRQDQKIFINWRTALKENLKDLSRRIGPNTVIRYSVPSQGINITNSCSKTNTVYC